MTPAGWIVFLGAITGMTGLLMWCVFKVIRTPESTEHMHAPVEIDTHDQEA